MPTNSGTGVTRLDINNPKDMAYLIKTGLVWRGGPDTIDAAIAFLQEHPEDVNDKVPAAVVAELNPPPAPPTDDELAEAPAAADEGPEGETSAPPTP